jgi:hypothetical protein
MEKAYQDLDIQFLPDNISTNNLTQPDGFLDNLNVINEHVQSFMMTYFEKLF